MPRLARPSFLVAILAAFTVVAASFALAACGGGNPTGTSGSQTATLSYTDDTYGFSFEYPKTWKLQKGDSANVTAGSTAKGNVGVYDPKGTNSDGSYFDVAEVSVYELKVTVDESMMPDVKTEVQRTFDQLADQGGNWKALDSLADVTVGGLSGWTISYSFDSGGGGPSYCRFYIVFGGALEYQLLVQASTKNWEADQKVFDAFVASFKPGSPTPTASDTSGSSSTAAR